MAATRKSKTESRNRAARKPTASRAPAKKAAAPQGTSLTEAAPSFTVNDLEKSLSFYRDVLGFKVDERWERDGKLMGVSLQAGKVTWMIGQDDWQKGRDRKKGEGFRLYCTTTENVDALARKIKSKGGKLDSEPADQPWGSRDFSLTDPDGFKITIGAENR
ncbi:MAG TPA: VOC family protein [Thermoanaerobaculia bacterium]|nr:VOC family protein [Thermoanaerobaculia bacterium]